MTARRLTLQLRRPAVQHIRDGYGFSDDVMLTATIVVRTGGSTIVTPCSDVATTISDLRGRREVATATMLLRPVERAVKGSPTVALQLRRPDVQGRTHLIAEATVSADEYDAALRALATTAQAVCAERGETLLVDDFTQLLAVI